MTSDCKQTVIDRAFNEVKKQEPLCPQDKLQPGPDDDDVSSLIKNIMVDFTIFRDEFN